MKILITGGAGYVGCALVPKLIEDGHHVVVYDTFWFGVRQHFIRLENRVGDIRDVDHFRQVLRETRPEIVIHLACLSNDPSSEIDKDLTKSINLDAFVPLVDACYQLGVRRFINCSTSSVYGVSSAPDVREDHPHVPLTLYNTYKSQCEKLFEAAYMGSSDLECVTIRPSTVCGYSERQRLDLAVNILTNLAVNKGIITVYGGQQLRPNLHIKDMVDCYRALIEAPADKIRDQTFNVGAGNISIMGLAQLVQGQVKERLGRSVEIDVKPIHDERSYQVNSDKIATVLGFRPKHTVANAIDDLIAAFNAGLLPDPLERAEYYNVRTMKRVFSELYKDAPPSAFKPEEGILSEQDLLRGAGQ